jgi:hypothetical protein
MLDNGFSGPADCDSFQQGCSNHPRSVLRVPVAATRFCIRQSQPQMKWHLLPFQGLTLKCDSSDGFRFGTSRPFGLGKAGSAIERPPGVSRAALMDRLWTRCGLYPEECDPEKSGA